MVYLEYNDFDELYHDLSRIPLLEYEKYKDDLILSGSTYYMNNVIIRSYDYSCSIDMSKLNYTIIKWNTLIKKYVDRPDYEDFKYKLENLGSKTCTFNFKVHKEGKDGCLIALVLTRDNTSKPWTDVHIFYRITEIYKKFAVDLILLNKIFSELPNCDLENIYFHFPKFFFRIEFLTELIGGYYSLEEFNEDNFATKHVKELWERYYTPGADLSKYHSIARKQKLKASAKRLKPIPIEELSLFDGQSIYNKRYLFHEVSGTNSQQE